MPLQVLTEAEAKKAAQDGAPLILIPGIPGGGFTVPRASTIASVHYEEKIRVYWRGGKRQYGVGAVPEKPSKPEQCSTCVVYDAQQWIPSHYKMDFGDQDMPTHESEPALIPMESIVSDLLRAFRGSMTGRMASNPPGIMQIAGTLPTQAELQSMVAAETRHCIAAVEDADELFFQQQFRKIGRGHRRALRWLGSERRKWAEEIEPGLLKKAPTTGTRIPMEALVDDRGVDLLEWYSKHGLNPRDFGDEYIAEILDRKAKAALPSPTKPSGVR